MAITVIKRWSISIVANLIPTEIGIGSFWFVMPLKNKKIFAIFQPIINDPRKVVGRKIFFQNIFAAANGFFWGISILVLFGIVKK
jgi:hypothetical protein